MSTLPVLLAAPLAVVPSRKVYEKLAPDAHPFQLVEEMSHLARLGTLPARLDDNRLVVYTSRHVAWLFPTRMGDAYSLGSAAPRTFRDEERLVRAAMLLRCPSGLHAYHEVRDVGPGMSTQWDLLGRAWQRCEAPAAPVSPLPRHHTHYLDLMTRVIEAGRDIEVARQHEAEPLHYRNKAGARERRHSARDVYAFDLLRPAEVADGAILYVQDQPDLRGSVVRSDGRTITLRFERTIDYARVPPAGALIVMPSDRIFKAQAEAVETLRAGRSANPGLLHQLVDRHVLPYHPDQRAMPREALDEPSGQLTAFRRALTVPDLLLVLGPPGTGKTRTISQIVSACAGGQRVLITSHTNRAVDNVLEKLPEDVFAIRVGAEDKMTSRVRGLMVEARVRQEQQRILAGTEGTLSALAPFADGERIAERWLDRLSGLLRDAAAAEREGRRIGGLRDQAARRVTAHLAGRLAATEQALGLARGTAEHHARARLVRRRRHAASRDRAGSGPLAFFFRWLSARRLARLRAAEEELRGAHAELSAAKSAFAHVREQAARLVEADPESARLAASMDTVRGNRDEALGEAARAAGMVRAMVRPWLPAPPDPPGGDLAGWEQALAGLASAVTKLRGRAALLTEWRAGIGDATEDLERELVRYAGVVGATCIGTATSTLLAELEFDLVIVDEAGQISTPNLLVPLVRGRRAVLVGDHRQLPPYLDDEVRDWAEGLRGSDEFGPAAIEEIGRILRHSAFERLYGTLHPDHQIMLRVQRRMPREIGDFVSRAFYGGMLRTEHPGGGGDPVFRSPFAMIDTSDLPAAERRERRRAKGSTVAGFENPAEAALIVRLITAYASRYADWAVIVPYRAQAELVRRGLRATLGGGPEIADHVGTVDSFQGGERGLIVYGFTRSNGEGSIGFLKELRRLNVAVSRAQRQLIVVGDATTLGKARDEDFGRLVREMLGHLERTGDRRPSREVGALLDALAEV